ncbi:MAG TPA: HAD-IIA family hydrolase [Chloroflexi bacterium]|jgi:4-nitrophenyl phosphatase|nr:HAD-IIA family hydrolase [Chloroflexota bacterium]
MPVSLASIRYLLIDMDGVLYRGQTGLPGGPELIAFCEEHGIQYLLVTNNSTLTPAQFVARLGSMGIHVPESAVMTSGGATAAYLSTLAPAGTRVNVVGEAALIDALEQRGFVIAGRNAEYVVCGWDKGITFEKLKTACLAIRDGATFIGTNGDKTYPLEKDIIPGAGSLLAALVAATDVEPLVVGKPEPIIFDQALNALGASRHETAILGDRLDTDILGGKRAGITTIMVLTGISSAEEAAAFEAPPDLTFDDLPALVEAWRRALGS